MILVEGGDAAGKGGVIKPITRHLNPRGRRLVALPVGVGCVMGFVQRG